MNPIRLHHIFVALVSTIALLVVISVAIPQDGIKIGTITLKFPTADQLMHPKKQQLASIDSLIAKVDTTLVEKPVIKHDQQSMGDMGKPNPTEQTIASATHIQTGESAAILLREFFKKIASASQMGSKIHILHYGDSQIEGDRMTGFIRERLQNQFGGNGPGLLPANNVYTTFAFVQEYSQNFRRYTCFGGNKLKNRKYGVMGSAARFTPEYTDSTEILEQTEDKTAWIQIASSPRAFARTRKFSTVKMFYNSCIVPCAINVYEDGVLIHQDSLIADGQAHVFKLTFSATPKALRFEFVSTISPTISNFSLEGDIGIQMSNIAMRGSSGTIFGSMDRVTAQHAMNELGTELIIMQFGGNSVPFFKDSNAVRNYARYFKGQLTTLKSMRPSAAIIVIGPSDMSKLTNGLYETYPLLPYCIEQMKEQSIDAGAGFWNLYQAMGGRNSMPAWVEKGLATNDYIHFSVNGARVAAQLFYDALMSNYSYSTNL